MRYLHHAEYRYGRALLALVVQCFGWDSEKLLADMPELSPAYCNMEDEEGEFWQQEAEDDGTLAPVALPRALVPIGKRNMAAKEVSEEKDARKAQPAKPRARKKSARKISPDAPENSPALHEDEDAPGREDSPVVEKAAPPPSATFFETAAGGDIGGALPSFPGRDRGFHATAALHYLILGIGLPGGLPAGWNAGGDDDPVDKYHGDDYD